MPLVREKDLSEKAIDEPLHEWAILEQELRESKSSPLQLWKEQYSRWRSLYVRFREIEQSTLYSTMRSYHFRIAIHALVIFSVTLHASAKEYSKQIDDLVEGTPIAKIEAADKAKPPELDEMPDSHQRRPRI